MNKKLDTALRSALGQRSDRDATQDRIRHIYAEASRRAEYHTSGLITADELIFWCALSAAELELLHKKL